VTTLRKRAPTITCPTDAGRSDPPRHCYSGNDECRPAGWTAPAAFSGSGNLPPAQSLVITTPQDYFLDVFH